MRLRRVRELAIRLREEAEPFSRISDDYHKPFSDAQKETANRIEAALATDSPTEVQNEQ